MKLTKRTVKSILCLALALILVLCMVSATTVFAAEEESVSEEVTAVEETTVETIAETEEDIDLADSGAGECLVYCRNSKGWSSVNVYCWDTGASDQNAGWPGVAMEDIGNDVWMLDLGKSYINIIFNGGGTQTGDLKFPGPNKIYDNGTGQWEDYDASPLNIKSFKTDLNAPQYTDVEIELSALASGDGTVSYKFSAKNNTTGMTEVLQDYSIENSVIWKPTAVATYTLTVDVKDTAGNEKSKTLDFEIADDSNVADPIIKSVTPDGGYVKKGEACQISVTAKGGKTGTNLLFYKYVVKDSSGTTVNVPYYTLNSTYVFTPSKLGTYSVSVSVQNSSNATVVKSVDLESVDNVPTSELVLKTLKTTGTLKVDNTIDATASASGGKAPYQFKFTYDGSTVKDFSTSTSCSIKLTATGAHTIVAYVKDAEGSTASKSLEIQVTEKSPSPFPDVRTMKGDADKDGKLTITDATYIQQFLAKIITDAKINQANADVDDNEIVQIVDATYIQQKLAGLNPKVW